MNRALPPYFCSLAAALESLFSSSVSIVRTERLSGGDINKAYALLLNDGTRLCIKTNRKERLPFFTAEAAGLGAIADTGTIASPGILCMGTDESAFGGCAFLLMEYVGGSRRRADYWETLGRELAAMHRASTLAFVPGAENPAGDAHAARFGFFQDNFIGARAQKNTPAACWTDFFRDMRLRPQFLAAEQYFSAADWKKIDALLDKLGSFLVEPERPSLLHGDLWNGNILCGSGGTALLIDPAVYVGHAEADLAMTELFGGFPPSFYAAYQEASPLQPGYTERRDLYNLYQLLNHLNLFGPAYLAPVLGIVTSYAG